MKKKNIAIMMAGVTVASTVAPVFADVVTNDAKEITVNVKDGKEAASKIKDMLAIKFQDVKGNGAEVVGQSVYEIKIDETIVTNELQVENAINAMGKNTSLVLNITDKGHALEDSKVINYTVEQYKTTDEVLADATKAGLYAKATAIDTVVVKLNEDAKESVTVKVGDNKLDFTDKKITDGKLTGFGQLFTNIEETKYEVTITKNEVVDSSVLFDGVRLTEKGAELLAELAATDSEIEVEEDKAVDSVDPGFTLETSFNIIDKTGNIVVVIANEDPQIIKELKAILRGEQADVNLVAGESRFTTAVEVSKQLVTTDGSANKVILVGEDAIVDGLAAAPLAKKEGAPILLTKKDALPTETEAEMLRVLGSDATALKNKTVYLVGGESRISKELEAKIAKLGVKVERLSGETRFETSLKIAEKVTTGSTVNANTATFVVGGDGEADAMSISAYAAQVEAPIVVVDKNKVSEEAMELLNDTNIEIIGGTGVVSENVEKQLKEIDKDKTVVRLAGDTRQGTNAKVINAHYNDPTIAFIAKDGYVGGNGKLIDALTAAPLAAKANAPMILTTNELTTEQSNVVEVKLSTVEKLVQVGKGIADSAIKTIVEKINTNK